MQISVQQDIKKFERQVGRLFRDQIPFATSAAINATAFDVRGREIAMMPAQMDRPTPFTLRGVQVRKGTKRNPDAVVLIMDNRGYLHYAIDGGTRQPKRRSIGVPTKYQKLNVYGNLPRGKIKTLLNKERVFSGTPKGGDRPGGIWERTNNNKRLRPLVLWNDSATYRGGQFKFYEIGHAEVKRVFNDNFRRAFQRAVRTSR